MLITKVVSIKWDRNVSTYYKNLGYKFTKVNDYFDVKIEDLPPNSNVKVEVQCDYCGKIIPKTYQKYNAQRKVIAKDCCKKCQQLKTKECNLFNFGVIHPGQLESAKEKRKQTNLERFGVDHPCKSEEIQDKIKQTNLERRGVEYTFQSKEVQEKSKETCLERYGVENVFQLEEVQEKIKLTNMKIYGVDNVFKSPEIRLKIKETLYRNNTGVSSKPQRYICKLLNGTLNYPFKMYLLDIAFPEEKIYIEYDGSGHEMSVNNGTISKTKFKQNQVYRRYQLYYDNWKEIRIVSKYNKIPCDDIILKMINYANDYFLTGHSWILFDIDNAFVKCSQYKIGYDFESIKELPRNMVI